jgi:hypothetical protein
MGKSQGIDLEDAGEAASHLVYSLSRCGRKEEHMSVIHSVTFTPPIAHPGHFVTWSRDVQKVLDYLPRYTVDGRKQRIFAFPWEEVQRHREEPLLEIIPHYYEQHHLQPLILPNHRQAYEHFIQQLPVSRDTEQKPFDPMGDYEEDLSRFYGGGPVAFGWPAIPGKGRYLLVAVEKGGREPLPIRGPDGTGEPVVTENEVAFNIDINMYDHDDAFQISLEALLEENEDSSSSFRCWKVAGDPHDVVVQAALIRLSYHFPEIEVHSAQDPEEWWEASLLCQKLFGVADLPSGRWTEGYKPGEEARRRLIDLANTLPDFEA